MYINVYKTDGEPNYSGRPVVPKAQSKQANEVFKQRSQSHLPSGAAHLGSGKFDRAASAGQSVMIRAAPERRKRPSGRLGCAGLLRVVWRHEAKFNGGEG